eukprot:5474304-Prymnesium_polylepis.1
MAQHAMRSSLRYLRPNLYGPLILLPPARGSICFSMLLLKSVAVETHRPHRVKACAGRILRRARGRRGRERLRAISTAPRGRVKGTDLMV